MSQYYPMMLKIEGKTCTVVGGGAVAERKVLTLLEYGAAVTVISPNLTEKLKDLAEKNKINHKERHYQIGDLTGSYLVFATTDDKSINKKCKEEAKTQGLFINVGDSPELSDFILPAIVRRGSLTLTISTEGKSPALSRKIRKELEGLYGEDYGEIVRILGEIREKSMKEISSIEDRKELFRQLAEVVLHSTTLEEMHLLRKNMWEIYNQFT